MPSRVTIRCLAAFTADAEEGGGGLVPLFVGREDGTVERYDAVQDAELGIPILAFHAHRKAVTGIVVVSSVELYTCSMDGTVKQWSLEDVGGTSPVGGPRVRAALVKTSTFPFAVHTMIPESTESGAGGGQQRIFLGGEDGSLTLMEGERRSTWPAHDGGALTAIAVDTGNSGSVITGGMDGLIYVWDMESGRPVCGLRGHSGPIRTLSVVAVPPRIPVVRSKRIPLDQIETDGSSAAPVQAPSELKDVLVYGGGDEDGGAGDGDASCLVSCSQDGTMKVWLLPELQEAAAEMELMERQQQQLQHRVSDDGSGVQRRSVAISFQEPDTNSPLKATDGSVPGISAAQEQRETAEDGADEEETAASPAENTNGSQAQLYNAKLHFLQQQAAAKACKSALKAPERRTVPFHEPLGTVELPHAPYTCSGPSSTGYGGEDGAGDSAAPLLFIGAGEGYVYGIKDRLLVKEVCQHRAYNFQQVQQGMRSVQRTLKNGVRMYAKTAASKMKAAEMKELRAAAKARKAKLAEERAARRKEAEERRAARRAAAAAAAEDDSDNDNSDLDEGDEEFEEEEEMEEEEMEEEPEEDEVEDAVEEEEEEEEEGGTLEEGEEKSGEKAVPEERRRRVFDGNADDKPRRPASWKKLSDEQRIALEALFAEEEKSRDERITALRQSAETHVAQLQPLAKVPYHRSRAQFSNLPYTATGCVRDGSAVVALASAPLVPGYEKVYVAQGGAVASVSLQFGVMKL